jgi:solute carrier family 35
MKITRSSGKETPTIAVQCRFTMVMTILIERIAFGVHHDWQVLASVGVMIVGALVAAMTDLSFSFWAYTSVLLNNLFTSIYLVLVKHMKATKHVDTTTLLFYNSIISIVPLTFASFFVGEWAKMAVHPNLDNTGLQITGVAAVCLGLTISHSMYVCTRVNDPLTTSVSGSLKNIAMTVIGIFAFGDYIYDTANMFGIALSMMGAVWYALYTTLKKTGS